MPPKVGAIFTTVSIKASTLGAVISISKTSISAKRLNNIALPSMTGLLANAPMLPKPSTAVPSVMTATKLPLLVYL